MASLSELPWLLLAWSARRRFVEGVVVCVAHSTGDPADVFARVEDALQLIAKHGPRFSARLRRDVKRLLFADVSGGTYLAGLRTCLIGIGFARRVSSLDLAMMIVHEAAHARLSRAGFRYRGERRERIERICVEAELAFAERVPGSEAAIAKVCGLLATEWWTTEHVTDATVDELVEQGVPKWLVAILRWLGSRRRTR